MLAAPTNPPRRAARDPADDDGRSAEHGPRTEPELPRRNRSDRLLEVLASFTRVVVVSHVNPDPDSLASMLGIEALVEAASPASR